MRRFYGEEYYKEMAYEFDTWYPVLEIMGRVLVNRFRPKQVLEIGCAKGYLVSALREQGVEAYGVDISEYAISHSPESIRSYLRIVDVDLEDLPFEPETFDVIITLECMEHLQHPSRVIAEMGRVLKPGGVVVVSVPKRTIWRRLFHLAGGQSPYHVNELTKSSWVRLFESHHFHYLGDFLRQEPKEVGHALRSARKRANYGAPPKHGVARFLCKLGRVGRVVRAELSLVIGQSEHIFFRWQP